MTHAGNPFDNGIVSDAWCRPAVDVPTIYGAVSDLCHDLLEDVRRHGNRRSLLIHGTAGSGKTHLLARLRATSMMEPEGAPLRQEPPPFFCYVRLATSPNMIRRHLRACLVRDLLRKDARGTTQLEAIMLASLAKEAGQPFDRDQAAALLRRIQADASGWEELRESFGELATRLSLDYPLARGLRLFLLRQRRHEVAQWLEHGELPDEVREQLGFDMPKDEDATADPERMAEQLVHRLARLVADTRPVVLCFDQIESLQVSPDDRTGFFAFGRLAADLFDQLEPLLLVTCAQSALLPQIRQAIARADYHRLAQQERVLEPLTEAEAVALIHARLAASPSLRDDPRRQQDPVWPLGPAGLRRFLGEGDRTPRRLIALCRDAFPHAGERPADNDAFLTDLFESRRLDAVAHLADPTAAFVHGLALVMAVRRHIPVTTPANRSDVDLVLSLPERQVAISVCNHEGNGLTAQLRRITQQPLGVHEERVVVRDMRLPIPHTSHRAWEYWQQLATDRERTAAGISRLRMLCPTPEMLAALEAVRSVMSDARAGELECRGRTIPPHAVEDWLRSRLRDTDLDSLVIEIEHGPARNATVTGAIRTPLRDSILELLQRRHVIGFAELSAATGTTPEALRRLITAGEPLFGVLGDPPVVVFERFAGAASQHPDPAI
jgi:hypothetical protein